jgi:NAD(P)-dependent dehydrogenase (short-subunit alcohol dehydrogenase family)
MALLDSLLACRSMERCQQAIDQIRSELQHEAFDGQLGDMSAMQLDLASFASIRRFADEYIASQQPCHVLVNNAALLAPYSTRRVTPAGLEESIHVNALGPHLLTKLLLPVLRRSQPARVIFVSSVAHIGGISLSLSLSLSLSINQRVD